MSAAQPPITSLEKLPGVRYAHHVADYMELLCLANVDGRFSKADLLDRWSERTDVGEDLVEEDVDEPLTDLGDPEDGDDVEPVLGPAERAPAALADRRAVLADDVFRHLSYRSAAFGAAYPFTVSSRRSTLVRLENMTPRRKRYAFLLYCSSLAYLTKGAQSQITRSFERLSADAMRAWLPTGAQVHPWGTSAISGRYRGNKWAKLTKLAEDLHEQLVLEQQDFASTDVGDSGADVVAWLPFDDANDSVVAFLAQATCKVSWQRKQHESSYDAWSRLMTFTAHPNNVLFVPFCFRTPDGGWYQRAWINKSVLVDRPRLLWLLRRAGGEMGSVPNDLLDRALEYREAVF